MTRIYHNPRCSKSRQTLALLQQRGLEPEIIEYLATPLDAQQVGALVDLIGDPHALLRRGEAAYAAAGLSSRSSRQDVVAAIVAHPILLERPVVVHEGRAALGRPPDAVLEILPRDDA